jgi:hypothetical protein
MLVRLLSGCRKYREKNKIYRILFTSVVTISSALTFIPLHLPQPLGLTEAYESALEQSVLGGPYQFSITVPLMISAPILLDILGDLFLRIQRLQSKPLCVYLRLILLIVFILPSILLIIPSASLGNWGQRFLSMMCMRNISVAGFLFSFISEEKRKKKKILSNLLIIAAFLSYVLGQLLWLISYSRISVMVMYQIRAVALTNYCVSYSVLLYLTSLWMHRGYVEQSKYLMALANARSSPFSCEGSDQKTDLKSSSINRPVPRENTAVTRRDSMISTYLAVMLVEPVGAAAIAFTSGGFDLHENSLRAVPWDVYFHSFLIILVRALKQAHCRSIAIN